jgi:hypothetical protein
MCNSSHSRGDRGGWVGGAGLQGDADTCSKPLHARNAVWSLRLQECVCEGGGGGGSTHILRVKLLWAFACLFSFPILICTLTGMLLFVTTLGAGSFAVGICMQWAGAWGGTCSKCIRSDVHGLWVDKRAAKGAACTLRKPYRPFQQVLTVPLCPEASASSCHLGSARWSP